MFAGHLGPEPNFSKPPTSIFGSGDFEALRSLVGFSNQTNQTKNGVVENLSDLLFLHNKRFEK